MADSTRPPANRFVAAARKVYNPVGFTKGYNFTLFFIFAGALVGFTLARFQFLALDSTCTSQGSDKPLDCFYYSKGSPERVGIYLHLGTILPAAMLVCLQFVPVIRHRFILFHRLNGYVILVLSLVSTAGVFMLARRAVGGWMDVQMAVGALSISFVVALALAVYNVKRLQIEQHRAWMLRAWFYAGSIITMRIIIILSALIISNDGYLVPMTCARVAYLFGSENKTTQAYPDCDVYFSRQEVDKVVLVPATMKGSSGTVMAALSMTFGSAIWLAFTLHAVGVEIYLSLTPAEANRLREISYERQSEAGMRNPGRAGLTADRIGDSAAWVPSSQREVMALDSEVLK